VAVKRVSIVFDPFDRLQSPFDHPFDHPCNRPSTLSIACASIPPYPPSARLRSPGSLGLALAIKPGAPPERASNKWMEPGKLLIVPLRASIVHAWSAAAPLMLVA